MRNRSKNSSYNSGRNRSRNSKTRSRYLTTACLIVLLTSTSITGTVFTAPAIAAEQWVKDLKVGQSLIKKQKYQEAEQLLELAIKNSGSAAFDSTELLDLYDTLAQAYSYTGKQQKAEELLKKSLDIREKSKKKNDLKLYQSIVMLAAIYQKQDRFTEAESLYKRALTMFQGKGPIKNLLKSMVHYALGQMYLDKGKPQDTVSNIDEALKLRQASFLKGTMPVTLLYSTLGSAYGMQKKYDLAEKNYKLALEAGAKNKKKDPRGYALCQANYAITVLSPMSRYDESRKMLEEARVTLEKTEGPEGQSIATCCANLATVAISQDRYAEAEELIRKAIKIHEKQLGPEHSDLATDLSSLAQIYRNQGKYDDAQQAAERSVKIYTAALGRNSLYTADGISTLAEIYADQGRFDEADKLAGEVLEIRENLSGKNTLDAVPILVLRARIASQNKKYEQAEQILKQAAEIQENNKNTDPSFLARVYCDLASLCERTNRFDEAEKAIKKSIALKEKIYENKHSSLLSDLALLNRVYTKQNRSQEANDISKKISSIKLAHPELAPSKTAIESTPIATAPATPGQAEPASVDHPVKDKWALVVGISNFADPSINLKYAAKDAIDFSRFLVDKLDFAPDHVKLLTDKEASRENILKNLGDQWLGRLANRDDLVVIYISSHGSGSKNESGGFNFLVAHDTAPDALLSTGVPMQWLSAIIKEQVHSNRIVTILDVCHSGSASGQKGLSRDSAFDVSKLQIGEGQAIICSSSPDQISWESKSYPNSVFTRQLIEALKENNKQVDLNQAFKFLSEQVEQEVLRDRGRLQTPLYFSKSWQGSPPVLSVQPVSPRKSLTH